jgi:hypothetical protein
LLLLLPLLLPRPLHLPQRLPPTQPSLLKPQRLPLMQPSLLKLLPSNSCNKKTGLRPRFFSQKIH